ncbi:MAG: AAA family ATPase [Candidatus Sungbacteria bacterium]|nr:AAA family ATPase [Candidatus Sungbacteria bacterium]
MRQHLTKPEQRVRDAFIAGLKITKRKTAKPAIIAMIGLVGSGKSFVARALAPVLGATIIEHDQIRIGLRKARLPYDHVAGIAQDTAHAVISQGGNVIFDTDCIGKEKQRNIRKIAKETGSAVFFVRVMCDPDIMLGRMLASSKKQPGSFFQGASSLWKGPAPQKAAIIKIREMLRRMPHHYRWSEHGGGSWSLKKFSPAPFTKIDTSDPQQWKKNIKRTAQKLAARKT